MDGRRARFAAVFSRGGEPPFNRPLWGVPAPIWTLALLYLAIAVMAFLGLLFPASIEQASPSNVHDTVRATLMFTATYGVIAAAWLMHLSDRVRMWMVHLSLVLLSVELLVIMAVGQSSASVTVGRWSFFLIMYAAYWMRPAGAYAYAVGFAVCRLFVLLWQHDMQEMIVRWTMTTSTALLTVVVVSHLTGYLATRSPIDPVTGLFSMEGLRIATVMTGARSENRAAVTLVTVSVDDYEQLVKQRGEIAARDITREIGELIDQGLGPHDVVARIDDGFFALVLPDADPDTAIRRVETLGENFPVHWAYGAAEWRPGDRLDRVIAAAEENRLVMEQQLADDLRTLQIPDSRRMDFR